MTDDLQPVDRPVTRAELAAILDAGTADAAREQTSSIGRMLTAICELTGVTLDDLLASVDLARASAHRARPGEIDPVQPHVYQTSPQFQGRCVQPTTLGWCGQDLPAPVHIPIQRPDLEPDPEVVDGINTMAAAGKALLTAALVWTGHRTRDETTGPDRELWDAAETYRKAHGEPPIHHHIGDILGKCAYTLPGGRSCGRLIEASVHYEPAVSKRPAEPNLGRAVTHSAAANLINEALAWRQAANDPTVSQEVIDSCLRGLNVAAARYNQASR